MTTFVLLHGIPGSSATWDGVIAALGGDHRVLAPDLLGFGGTPRGAGPDGLLAPSQARYVRALLERERVDRAVVVGHDFGGPVAATLLAHAPERVAGLGLLATNAFPDSQVPFPLSTVTLPLVGGLAARALFSRPSLAAMLRRGVGEPFIELDRHAHIGDRSQHGAIAEIFATSLRRLGELYTPVAAALASATVPTLVGWGDRDPFFPVAVGERTAALVPGARFRLYSAAGHFLPQERPRELAADLAELAAAVAAR